MTSESSSSSSSNDVPFFYPNAPDVPPAFSDFFTGYTRDTLNLQSADLPGHLLLHRNRAFAVVPFPCLGLWQFLDIGLSFHPWYGDIVRLIASNVGSEASSSGPAVTFLDLGCCLGQDLRRLIWDVSKAANRPAASTVDLGANMFGAELKHEFIDIGYELFKDEGTLPRSQFLAPADIFDDAADAPLRRLQGKVSIVSCMFVFHLFDWETQVKLARRLLLLLNRKGVHGTDGNLHLQHRALIVGFQVGTVRAGYVQGKAGCTDLKRWLHNPDSWQRLWKEAVAAPEWAGVVKDVSTWSELKLPEEYGPRVHAGIPLVETGVEGLRMQVFLVSVDFH